VWSEVVSLPNVLMQEGRAAEYHAPIKAAVLAQLAVAIAILTFAPVRRGNLISIELDKNLIKPGGSDSPYWLVFQNYDVKNRQDLNFKFDRALTDLIDEYIHDFRPTLLRGANTSWLFPGEDGKAKHKLFFSKQITVHIQKAIGLRITVHQFRHAAAAIYETVRRLLGHRNIWTTIKFYCGLETIEATEQFGSLIRQQIKLSPSADEEERHHGRNGKWGWLGRTTASPNTARPAPRGGSRGVAKWACAEQARGAGSNHRPNAQGAKS
jgi:integrase